ncbi:MAG: chemotaxis protein CheA [Pseudomonadota bacterium]
MSDPTETFRQEAAELLETLEENLLELEGDPESREKVDVVFRALHTIKGSGEMFGFAALAKFVHNLENAFDLARSGKAPVTSALIDVSLNSRDHIIALLGAGQDEAALEALTGSDVHAALSKRIAALSDADATAAVQEETAPAEEQGTKEFQISFRPEPAALRNGMRPDLVSAELGQLGECTAQTITDHVPPLEDIDAGACYLAWQYTLETDASRDAVEQLFLFFDDGDIEIEEVVSEVAETAAEDASADVDGGSAPAKGADQKADTAKTRNDTPPKTESVRVQSHRLDELMDQLGELVIAQARLNRISERIGDPALGAATEEIERLVTAMRDATLSIRMLPIAGVFGKFRRVVRDLSTELGKSVSLVTEGGETELDKNIIDRLSDPLVHIIRNAVDHGIESADDRLAAGKPQEAVVRMIARQRGSEVHIIVSDDGGGLKTGAIRKRAIERGLIDEGAEVSDEAIHQLIFAPGFSTSAQVTNISGRGVGMDAVRNFIEDLRGAVEVKSVDGEGTSVTLKLPLTLAIIDGLLIRVDKSDFVLPLSNVEECVELSDREAQDDRYRSILNIRDELVPYVNLREIFGFSTEDEPPRRIVIVNADGRRIGMMVDDVIGQYQTVIKSLSTFHRALDGLAGCTILGDGSVALIIDPAALIKSIVPLIQEAA